MSASYCFLIKGTDTKVPIASVDTALREYLGLPPDVDNCCFQYEVLVMAGIAASMHGKMNKESYEELLHRLTKDGRDEFVNIYEEFLGKRYDFDSWR
jgi:hypothetical protein